MNEKVYLGFINLFADKNPLHIDDKFAKEYGMPQKVMHGNILNGFLSHFIGEMLPMKNVIIHSQTIKYRKPVFLNDRLILTLRLEKVHESVNVYIFKYAFSKINIRNVATGEIQIGALMKNQI